MELEAMITNPAEIWPCEIGPEEFQSLIQVDARARSVRPDSQSLATMMPGRLLRLLIRNER